MRHSYRILAVASLLLVLVSFGSAQIFFGGHLGFKSYGLKGTIKENSNVGNVVDAGKTAFTFGIMGGCQVLPEDFAGGWYKLDLALEASYQSVSFFEAGYNSQFGAGKFAASGLSGGSTSIISFDVMPIHRLTIPKFKLLSPYAGLGFTVNIMSTGDVTAAAPTTPGTLTGNGEVKVGLLVFYGVVLHATDMIEPYLQFKHMIPFGSESQFSKSFQATGGGSQNEVFTIQDVPGYFNLSAGVRITL